MEANTLHEIKIHDKFKLQRVTFVGLRGAGPPAPLPKSAPDLTVQTSRVGNVESQLRNYIKDVADVLSQLVDKVDKLQPLTTLIPTRSPSPTSRVERIILVYTSTPYQHLDAHNFNNSRQPPFQDRPR
jgi:hypothetical protein